MKVRLVYAAMILLLPQAAPAETDYTRLIATCTGTLEANPDDTVAYKNLAAASEQLGQAANAAADRRKYEELIGNL